MGLNLRSVTFYEFDPMRAMFQIIATLWFLYLQLFKTMQLAIFQFIRNLMLRFIDCCNFL